MPLTHGSLRLSALLSLTASVLLTACLPDSGKERAPTRENWLTAAMNGIEQGSYSPREVDNGFAAVNTRNDFRVAFNGSGADISEIDGAWSLSLRTEAWGTDAGMIPVAAGRVARGACLASGERDERGACLRQVNVHRDGLTEWWKNRQNGLEHGYTVEAPLGEGDLLVQLSVEGADLLSVDEHSAELLTSDGTSLLYSGLFVWDSTGRELPAVMEAVNGGLQLRVDVAGAVWPVEIDPSLTNLEANQASASFGIALSGAGDVNGDGFDDVAVGAHAYDNGSTNEGRAFVYLGSATGVSTTAAWTAEPNQGFAQFGRAIGAGDFNGDGYGDLAVGAPYYDNGQTNEGRVYVYYGSATGLGTSATTVESNQASALFGSAVASAGDVNGDGRDDLIVGAPYWDNGQTDEGGAWTYLGAASTISTTAAWTVESNQASARMGWSVSTAGDVNGDSYFDVIVGAPLYDNGQTNEGRASVYHGSVTGLATSASWTGESNQAQANFATAVSTARDVNGDSYDDVVIGAPLHDNGQTNEGRASVYHGGATGLAATAAWTAESNQASAYFGQAVAGVGDTNGDGYDDVLVGAYLYDGGQTNEGMIALYQGSSTGVGTTATLSDEINQASAYLGYSVAAAGDIDADGLADYLAGAYLYDGGSTDEGLAILYLSSGSDNDLDGDPDSSDCDDTDATIYNGAPEICDGVDEDCDSVIDDNPTDGTPYYADTDSDLYGDVSSSIAACSLPTGYSADNTDCDDTNATVYPGAPEICDALDNDCDTVADDGAGITWYPDGDLDGYGGAGTTLFQCPTPTGYADLDGDCDDANAAINPGAAELDNTIDEDCDDFVDEDFVLEGDLVITEIMRQPRFGGSVTVNNGMWFEILNVSARDVVLDNLFVRRSTAVVDDFNVDPLSAVVLPAGDYAVFCATNDYEGLTATDLSHPLICDYFWKDELQASDYVGTYQDNTFNLQRDTDTLALYVDGDQTTGRVIDSITWTFDATNGYWPRDARFSTSLDPLHLDGVSNDSEAYWCSTCVTATGTLPNNNNYRWYNTAGTYNDDHGTPGALNYDCPSIP